MIGSKNRKKILLQELNLLPPYAVIFMAALEGNILESLSKKSWLWWRYIDDSFMIWHHGENELKQFIDKLNKFHPTIKFTCDYSRGRVHFLDVQVISENNEISTDLYVKETNSHQYLHPSSCHPYHWVKSIPYSQALRLNQICSNNIFYDNRCNQSEKWLSDRNYKQKLVREQIFKARVIPRETLLNNERNPQLEDWLVLNLMYHPLLRDFQKVLKEAQILLTSNEEHKTVFGEKPPMIGWHKVRTLKNYLVRAKLNNSDTKESKSAQCNGKRCQEQIFSVRAASSTPVCQL